MKIDLNRLPWYDNYWHSSYINAKKFIANYHPEKLEEFIKKLDVLKTNECFYPKTFNDIISAEVHETIIKAITTIQDSDFEKDEFIRFGRLTKHNLPLFNEIQSTLIDKVSEIVGEEVEASYNFLSLYNVLGVLRPHMDAPSAKWTLDFCIDQSEIWPIYLSKVVPWPEDFNYSEDWMDIVKNDPENEFKEYHLTPGNAIIFGGSSQWHYRERLAKENGNKYCHLIFFHFIPKGTKDLCKPKKWSSIFGIPELDDYVFSAK
jgi:hypothetical protein